MEITALLHDKRTLSMTLTDLVEGSTWRKLGFGAFCVWLAFHINC